MRCLYRFAFFHADFGKKLAKYKNAFQWDAYRPLVDHIPACTGWGVYPSMHWMGGVSVQGVSAGGGGGVADSPPEGRKTPPVDRQTPVKT